MSNYETVWTPMNVTYLEDRRTDGKFIPISDRDRTLLEKALRGAMKEDREDEYPSDIDTEYYLERLEATHFFIFVTVPDDADTEEGSDEWTWWDFSCVLSKQVDDVWYVWSEDPGDTGNIWYQTTYTKEQAYAVRDLCIQWAERGELYNDIDDNEYNSETETFYKAVKDGPMSWW